LTARFTAPTASDRQFPSEGTRALTEDEVWQEFRDSGALLKGHFILSSGLHSDTYLQCARVMMDAARGGRLCAALAEKLKSAGVRDIGMVIALTMGAILPIRNGPPARPHGFLRAVAAASPCGAASKSSPAPNACWSRTL
jgi:hypothetical protein